jgi:hypothetical protein
MSVHPLAKFSKVTSGLYRHWRLDDHRGKTPPGIAARTKPAGGASYAALWAFSLRRTVMGWGPEISMRAPQAGQ